MTHTDHILLAAPRHHREDFPPDAASRHDTVAPASATDQQDTVEWLLLAGWRAAETAVHARRAAAAAEADKKDRGVPTRRRRATHATDAVTFGRSAVTAFEKR